MHWKLKYFAKHAAQKLLGCISGIPSFYNMNRIGNKSFRKIERIAF